MIIATLGAIAIGVSVVANGGSVGAGVEDASAGGTWDGWDGAAEFDSVFVVSPFLTDVGFVSFSVLSEKLFFCFLLGKHMSKNGQDSESALVQMMANVGDGVAITYI